MTERHVQPPRFLWARRRGGAYIAVLGIAMLVGIMAVGAINAVRSQARAVNLQADTAEARSYAISAIELGRLEMATNTNWRTTHKSDAGGAWIVSRAMGSGTGTLTVVNPNGALDNSPTDPVVATGTGVKGNARQIVQVTLAPQITPLSCLGNAITCNGSASLGRNVVLNCGMAVLGTNANLNGSTSGGNPGNYTAYSQAVGNITGAAYNGFTATGVTAFTMPSSPFTYYGLVGTSIPIASLPTSGGTPILQNLLLSPSSNPFGTADSNGIYVINCQSSSIIITNCRIVGTLVLANCNGLLVQKSATLAPAVAGYPCLMVQGAATFNFDGSTVKETSGGGCNMNPAGTPYPYPGGTTNATSTDTYASGVQGLAYVSGNCSVTGNGYSGVMLIVGGSLTLNDNVSMTMTYDSTYYNNPAPGFCTINMVPSAGTWKQLTN